MKNWCNMAAIEFTTIILKPSFPVLISIICIGVINLDNPTDELQSVAAAKCLRVLALIDALASMKTGQWPVATTL